MNSFFYQQELDQLKSFFTNVQDMTEEQIQTQYNCDDTKEEFLAYLEEEIDEYEEKYQEALQEEESSSKWETAGLDPAFSSWRQVYSMFI